MKNPKKWGWRKDSLDWRDVPFMPALMLIHLPENVDLRRDMPSVYNQLTIGSCTSNALAAVMQYERKKQGGEDSMPSRLFHYYNERVIENTVDSDSGAELRDGIKTLAGQGICPEVQWPYDVSKFAVKPPQPCYDEALKSQALKYYRINQRLRDLQSCLAEGNPFVFGFAVFEYFVSSMMASTGVLKMPTNNEEFLGGHAVCAVGYDNSTRRILCRNSWGENWGTQNGHFWMPYEYILNQNLAADFWKITAVEI